MNRIVKFICIFFIVFICLQFSSCDNGKNDKLIYSYGEYTCEIIGITEDVETIIIPKMHDGLRVSKINNNAFKNASSLKKVFYEGTIDDWQKIKIDAFSGPMIHAEEMYFLNEDNVYYLVEEVSFDVKELNMNNFCGFDCLKTIHLSNKLKSISVPGDADLENIEKVYYEGTLEDWQKIDMISDSSPMIHAEEMYCLNQDGEYYLVEEASFDETELDMNNFYGFDCLKTIHLSEEVKSIKMPKSGDLANLEKVYYDGTLEDWLNIEFDNWYSNPMYYAEEIYMKKDNEYYLVEEIKFDSEIVDISNIVGFDCLKKIHLTNKFKKIYNSGLPQFIELNVDEVYYEGTLEDWLNLEFTNEYENPMYFSNKLYLLNDSNEYYLLDEIIIPDNVTEIKNYQFVGISNIEKIVLDDHISKYGELIFSNVEKIKNVYIGKTFDFNKNIFENTIISNLYFDGTIEEWFELKIDYNPISFTDKAYFKNDKNEYVLLTNLVIPSNITKLDSLHFSGYKGLESLYIHKDVDFIDPYVLKDCSNIRKIEISKENKVYDSRKNYNAIIETATNKIIFGGNPTEILDSIEEIGEYSFIGSGSDTITIPSNIKIIPSTLYYKDKIESVYYEGDLEEWFKLSDKHFFMNIDNIDLYLLNENNEYYVVKDIIIPNNVKKISASYFSNIKGDYNIYLHDDIEEMYANAFINCEGIKVYYEGTYEEFFKINFIEVKYNIGIIWNIDHPLIYSGEFYAFNENGEYKIYYKQ